MMNAPVEVQRLSLPPPLTVARDMRSVWADVDCDYDTAAEQLVTAHRNDGDLRDLPVMDLRAWGVKADHGQLALAPLAGHEPARPLRSNAFSQLSNRLGAPVDFIRDRLPAPLQLATMNYLLMSGSQPMSAQLRLRGDEISAVVSDRYAPLDAEEFVDALRQALSQQGLLSSVRARSVATGTTDVLRLVIPSESEAIRVGDVTAVGLDLSTSSFGRSALHVRGLLWRLKCTNGLRATEGMGQYSYRHVGDTQRLRDGLRDAIPTALVHARGVMGLWKQAVSVFVNNVAAEIESLRSLTAFERERLEEEIEREAGVPQLPERLSAYDFINSVTAMAHDQHGTEPARRLEIEELAGGLLRRHVGRA
jgi:hypothetical protein